jgi:hypothetical protein
MDNETERVWLAFVQAEQAYRESMGALRHVDMLSALREGLLNLTWRRPALAVLASSSVEFSEQLLPELFQLSAVSHSLIGEVRRCILRIPRERIAPQLQRLVRQLIDDPSSDYEAYRRIAELLSELEGRPLLGVLIHAARKSSDADIRDVAADFEEFVNNHDM